MFLGNTQVEEIINELMINSKRFPVSEIIEDVKSKGSSSQFIKFTDPDNQQICIKLSDEVYIYSQQDAEVFDEEMKNIDVEDYFTNTIDVEELDKFQIKEGISGFYSSLDELKDIYSGDWKQILAECVFEN